jgi:hypothetical protein
MKALGSRLARAKWMTETLSHARRDRLILALRALDDRLARRATVRLQMPYSASARSEDAPGRAMISGIVRFDSCTTVSR